MSGILLHHPAPGATTCIIIGALPESAEIDLTAFRAILWWISATRSVPGLAGIPQSRVQMAAPGKDDPVPTLERFIRLNPRNLPTLVVSRAINGPDAEAYQNLITATHRMLEGSHRTRLTRQQDGFTWQKHILQNASAYAQNRVPDSWAGALSGLPAFVCGAGPSLDLSINPLATSADRAVIFSADSALHALARKGIQADFAVSIDVAKIPSKCLPGDRLPARVVLASISPPAWQESVPENSRFYLSGNQLTDDWFAQQGVPRTALTIAESCGSTAIELAHFLGCDPIYLFGLDLAVDPANPARRHQKDADPSLYKNSNYDPTAQLPRVPGNYCETVPCFALGDWQDLDARLFARTNRKIFNVNDRGARLRGTTLIHPERFALDVPAGSKHTPLDRLPNHTAAVAAGALARLRTIGGQWRQAIPALRQALEDDGAAGLANAFRPLLLDPANGRALGSFALKLMPHLVPPIEGDRVFWENLITEFEELAGLACSAKA